MSPEWDLGVSVKSRASCQSLNPLSPGVKLQEEKAVKISIELNLSDHVLNSHDLTN